MAALLSAILWVLLALIVLLLIVLSLPLRLELQVRKEEHWCFSALIRPLGRFGPGIPLSRKKPRPKARKEPAAPHRKKRRGAGHNPQTIAIAVLRLLQDLLALIRLEHLKLDAEIGLGDPADTGQLYGALLPVEYAVSGLPRTWVRITPAFDRAVLSGAAELALSVVPILLFGPAFRFGRTFLRGAS